MEHDFAARINEQEQALQKLRARFRFTIIAVVVVAAVALPSMVGADRQTDKALASLRLKELAIVDERDVLIRACSISGHQVGGLQRRHRDFALPDPEVAGMPFGSGHVAILHQPARRGVYSVAFLAQSNTAGAPQARHIEVLTESVRSHRTGHVVHEYVAAAGDRIENVHVAMLFAPS